MLRRQYHRGNGSRCPLIGAGWFPEKFWVLQGKDTSGFSCLELNPDFISTVGIKCYYWNVTALITLLEQHLEFYFQIHIV